MKNSYSILTKCTALPSLGMLIAASGLFSGVQPAYAHNPEKYAASSRLATDNWARVEVSGTGMHFVSNATISNLGLNPSTTNVYGYGGRHRPDRMAVNEPDDLPLIPSMRVEGGIVFFGTDNITWEGDNGNTGMDYVHINHPYSNNSYYFLSDRTLDDGETAEPAVPTLTYAPVPGLTPETSFRARILHEQDIIAPSDMGRTLLGEDFRANPRQTFRFDLPGHTGKENSVYARVVFGANVSGSNLSLLFTADAQRLPSSSNDIIGAIKTDSEFLKIANTIKSIPAAGQQLLFGIEATTTGVVTTAGLDYIELEYDRELKMPSNGTLYFYGVSDGTVTYNLANATAQTRVWDVTDPARPVEIDFAFSGSNITFTDRHKGAREYMAFNPDAGWRSSEVRNGQKVANQNLHGLPNPHMVIIAPSVYASQAEQVAQLHRDLDGMTVHVLTPQLLYNEFSCGNPDVGAFRKALKMWGDRADADSSLPFPAYCLIIGRASNDNKQVTAALKREGYPIVPIWLEPKNHSETTTYSTDDYIGMTEDSDLKFVIEEAKIRTAVGRWPVKTEEEASILVEKLTTYLTQPDYGPWRNNVLLIADDQDHGEHLKQMEDVYNGMVSQGNGEAFVYEKLYLDSYPLVATSTGHQYPDAKARMLLKWNDGVSWIQYIGHAAVRSWSHEQLLTWLDINSFSNARLPFLFAATCHFAHHDRPEQSGAEVLLFNPNGGIIGTICPSRTVYIARNGALTKATAPYIYARDAQGRPNRVGDVYRLGKNKIEDDNRLKFALLSDPALPVPSPQLKAVVDQVDGVDMASLRDGDEPVVGARQKFTISGHIEDMAGNVISDFNGRITTSLYDAEKVITTYGNGKEGEVMEYNDRKTRLLQGAAKVDNGRWEMTLLMPSEIENNFSPAFISLYASSDKGYEANGSCSRLYVYGADENAGADTEGPAISLFTLNSDAFMPGDITHPDPMVLAAFSDDSGINLSEAGIGHSINLFLDGKRNFSDVAQFYEPDMDIPGSGRLAYPLSDLEPGDHELTLTVWDTAGNSSSMTLPFRVGLNEKIDFVNLTSDASPARDKTVFTLTTDRLQTSMSYQIEVFNLSGKPVWNSGRSSRSRNDGTLRHTWYLTDMNGQRVPRGIYLCRATVETDDVEAVSKTIKIAVAAQ